MSTLLIQELYDGVVFTQNIKINTKCNLAFIRLWIYKEGTLVDGDFTLNIKKDATIIKTLTISYEDINDITSDNYLHGYIRFDIEGLPLFITDNEDEEEYTLEIFMDNHTTDENNFVGISKEFDVRKYDLYGTLNSDLDSPAGLEIYTYRS